MSDKLILLATLILLLLPVTSAFELFKSLESDPVCPSSTGVFVDILQGAQEEITLSKSGSASSFTTLFLYKDKVYAYVTPKSATQEGVYSLTITASSSLESKSITHNPQVIECQLFNMKMNKPKASVCPCESDVFELTLENVGASSDTYQLAVSGPASSLVLLSESVVSIPSKEKRKVMVYVQDTCTQQGEKEFTITATPKKARTQKSVTSSINIDACYDFSANMEKTFTQICAGTSQSVDITVKNEGTTENTYNVDSSGPAWSHLENSQLSIKPSQELTTSIILNPPHKAKNIHTIGVEITSDKGNFKLNSQVEAEVIQCIGVGIEVDQSQVNICTPEEYSIPLTVKNTGSQEQEFTIVVEGPTWVSLEDGNLFLKKGESEEVLLSVTPPSNIPSKEYAVTIKVNPKGISSISEKKTLVLNTLSQSECYRTSLVIEKDSIQLSQDSTATIPIMLENKGIYEAIYKVDLTGSAGEFSNLVPISTGITISPGSTEQIYLYLTPSLDIGPGEYTAVVSTRLEDSEILAEDSVTIRVSEQPERLLEGSPTLEVNTTSLNETSQNSPSVFQRIGLFFRNLFSNDESQAQNETNSQVWVEGTSSLPTVTLEDGRKIVEIDLDKESPYTYTTQVEELVSLKVNKESYASSLDSVTDTQAKLVFSPGPITVYLSQEESKQVDLDLDSLSDLGITLESIGPTQVTYKKLEESEKRRIEQEKEEELGEETVFLDSEGNPLNPTSNPEGRVTEESIDKGPLGKLADYIVQNKIGVIVVLGALLALAVFLRLKMPKKGEPKQEIPKQEIVKEAPKIETQEEKKETKSAKKEEPKKEEKKDTGDDDEEFEIIH